MAPKKGQKKNKAVLIYNNNNNPNSWADDKVEKNESSNMAVPEDKMTMMMNPVVDKRPKQFGIGGAIPPNRDMHKVVHIQSNRMMIPKQVPPAFNQFTNTLHANLGSSSSYTSALVDEFNFSALFDEEGISPVSDENYANQMQLQEVPKQQFKVPPALNQFANTLDKNLGSSSSYTSALVDEFNFSALFDEEGISPVSDENYANQMQLQEVLMSAVISSTLRNRQPSEEGIPPSKKGKKVSENKVGHTSQSRSFCNICFDYKGIEEMFPSTCRHTFCKDCICNYVASKIHGNVTRINCPVPNCSEWDIGPNICREIVPKEVLERWENVLCESLIIGSQKFYCPFKDCSAVMLDDGEEKVTSSECPNCRRLFCAQCNVAWHAGIDCSQFKSLNENGRENVDMMLMELAIKKKWRRCPKCQFYVAKISGCLHIRCRCGYEFCYGCGSMYTSSHACKPRGTARRRNTMGIARRRNI